MNPTVWQRKKFIVYSVPSRNNRDSIAAEIGSIPSTQSKQTSSELRQASVAVLSSIAGLLSPLRVKALAEADVQRRNEAYLNDDMLRKAEVNIQSDDFWYPPFLIGEWNTSLIFDSAKFMDKIPVESLASSGELPGFEKYSVFFLPDMGKDVTSVPFRYVQIDGHPREDHPRNVRNLVQAFLPNTVVDSAPYFFQKAPDWFHSPANKWRINYHDESGVGQVDLLTQKRNLRIFAGTVESAEFIRQSHRRIDRADSIEPGSVSDNGNFQNFDHVKPVVTDYCLNWRLTVPASLRDEFVTVEDLRRTTEVVGALDVYVYLQPSNDLYLNRPGRPAGVFTYNVTMHRKDGFDDSSASLETEKTTYPFVWRDVGPVELDRYFGY